MRFVIAVMRHETNTFSPLPTVLEDFGRGMSGGPATGAEAVRAMAGTNNPIAAFLDIAKARGAEAVVPIAANASPSGKVTDDAFPADPAKAVQELQAAKTPEPEKEMEDAH